MEEDFVRLIEANRQRILRICRVYAWTPQDEEDLYQDILFQIWRGLPKLQERVYANTWLYRVALNTAISFVRRNKSQRNVVATEPSQLHHWMEHRQEAGGAPDRHPRIDSLYEALAKLNPVEKGLITLYLEDLSYEEIAEVMGMNANQVGVLLHRTKKKLSELMKEVPV
jgi:RNA polymerase sigma-70 factor (ECF subfamily)